MEVRKILLYLALKYKGDWDKIYRAVELKEDINEKDVKSTFNAFKGNFITILDEEYPAKLKNALHPPFVLFYQGNIDLLKNKNIISVSCSRNVSRIDYHNATQILSNKFDVTYLVGSTKNDMDKEITRYGKPTIAVIGHSLMAKQPLDDYDKFDLVITEVPPNVIEITKDGMMWRTRTIAGLCDKELVISAPKMSGTAVVVNWTLELGKDVLVIPKIEEDLLNTQLLEEGAICCVSPRQLTC